MSFSVKIRQVEQPITVKMGQTILDAALEQGVNYPFDCRAGNCAACKSRLYSGEVEMASYSEFALSQAEKDEGLVLCCRAVPWSDCEIAWLESEDRVVHPLRIMRCTITAKDQMTHDIWRIKIRIDGGGPYTFTAGQFADLEVPGRDIPQRQYSMANRPEEAELEFHVRQVPNGLLSNYVAEKLAVGDLVRVKGPNGSAYYREKDSSPIIGIAGGSGLAPIMSIVETALHAGATQPIHFYYGARDERDLYLVEHFENLAKQFPNFKYVPVLSEPSAATTRRTGFVTDAVRHDFKDMAEFRAYLCGPPPMVNAATALCGELGVIKEKIHADAFYTQAEQTALGGAA
ncbi:MAG: 2Fe-2S iron-sulfur cluster binding domain-containing protein [Gammaproteobacteria bacterium]|nr:2Fe-2S iron-sulfur cluster binding domain-containing protein [Gammaproteobacteria bacterium]